MFHINIKKPIGPVKKTRLVTTPVRMIGKVLLIGMKIIFSIFLWLCFVCLAACILYIIIIGIVLGEDVLGMVIILFMIVLVLGAVYLFARKTLVSAFESFAFTNVRGLPSGEYLAIMYFFMACLSIIEKVTGDLPVLLVILALIVSVVMVVPSFRAFSKWYENKYHSKKVK